MNRALTLLAASACAAVAVSSACLAADWNSVPFRLAKSGRAGAVQLSMEQPARKGRSGNWSQPVALADLHGLNATQLTSNASTPIRFSLVRPAGRLDCRGSARSSDGRGTCAFAANGAFAGMLAKRGVGRPTAYQSYQLALANFRPEVLDALAGAGYPCPTVEQSIALGIFAIDPGFVRGLADAGYRLGKIDDLVGFKIHRVTPDFIRGFASLGYRDLPAGKLLQLRIFNVTPDDVRAVQAGGAALPSADQLVRLRLAGFGPKRSRK